MKYAIIAAGKGSRLRSEGIKEPKPLIKMGNETLIERLINIFIKNEATEIIIIVNEDTPYTVKTVKEIAANKIVPIQIIKQSTPSSMHSFYAISSLLEKEPFIMTTIDTVFKEDDFSNYVKSFKEELLKGTKALMGVTDSIDDEKPLYINTDKYYNITGFYDQNDTNMSLISAGVYGLTPETLKTLDKCIKTGQSRMRNFQRAIVNSKMKIKAFVFNKVIDIDHKDDIIKAKHLIGVK